LSGCFFATKAHINNRKKLVKHQYLLHMSPQYGKLWPTSGWERTGSLGHPFKFQRVSRLGSYCTASSSGCQPNFAALNRGRHLYSARRPSRWALANISSSYCFSPFAHNWNYTNLTQEAQLSQSNCQLLHRCRKNRIFERPLLVGWP